MSRVLTRSRSYWWLAAGVALLAALAFRAMPASADTLEVHVTSFVSTRVQPSMSAAIAGTLMPGEAYIVTGTQVADGTTWYELMTPDGTSLGWADAASVEVITPDNTLATPDVAAPDTGLSVSDTGNGGTSQTVIQNAIEAGVTP